MIMAQFLWRLDGAIEQLHRDGWQQGFTLHLLFQSLSTIIVRRDDQTRHYLALEGCPMCRPDGCDRMCHRMLFAQLIRTTLSGVVLTPAVRLPSRATETRQVLAVPQRNDAQLLDATFLAQWTEGRLVSTWSRLRATPQPITVGVRLAVSADGPDLVRALRTLGWRALPLASLLSRRAQQADVPPPAAVGARASETLFAAFRDPQHLVPSQLLATEEV